MLLQTLIHRGAIARVATGLVLAIGATATALAQSKPDTVYRYNPRTERSQAIQGIVSSDTLEEVTITDREGEEDTIDSLQVLQIVWGEVPTAMTEGRKLLDQGAYGDALERLRAAAADGTYREPVRAAARLEATEALIEWGATEPGRFSEAVAEAERFMADFSNSRLLPRARMLKARAAWLSGDAAAARDSYKALHEAGKDGAAGYAPIVVAEAALHGAHAALDAGDGAGARELFTAANAAFGAVTSEREPIQRRAAEGADVASLGDALAKVAEGDGGGARSALERAMTGKDTAAGRGAARLALARVHLAEGNHFDARLAFGWVAALDHSSGDRRAEAALGLAETAAAAGDTEGARQMLAELTRAHGDRPAAAKARKMLESL